MGPEAQLTLDAMAADFVVDLSNVMRDDRLCGSRPVDLRRFLDLLAALVAYTGDEAVQVYAVADRSLLRQPGLTADEKATLHRWYERGRIEVRPGADDRLIELAETAELRVISRDNFEDAYREHPWIPGNRDRFLHAVSGPGGAGVVVVPRIMPTPPEWHISRKEEESRLLRAGMYDRRHATGARRELLTRQWRCPRRDCPMFGDAAAVDQPVPVYRQGVVRCPTHHEPMADIGPSTPRVQLKVRIDGVSQARFMVRADAAVVVGRAPVEPGGVALASWLTPSARNWISRRHVELSWDGTALAVRDLSANGTRIRREGTPETGRRIGAGRPWRLRKGEVIVLHEGVELVLSGRAFVFENPAQPPAPRGALAEEAATPTMIRRPKPR
ncbi:FHA domain-containing protein [Micromonospora sp. NPDC049274]|uniref:FHA domain-containing protein n=1 Tax=Micromonospora sp. NPDC049274 TaxID=3154829 RepID=UPI0034184F92